MKAKRSKLNLYVCSLLTAATLTLGGCTSTSTQKIVSANAFGPLTLSTQEYQNAYNDASEELSYKALILLARSKIVSGDLKGAKQDVATLETKASTQVEQQESTILKAMILSRENHCKGASDLLKSVKYNALPKQDISYYLILNSNVNARLFKQTKNPSYQIVAYKNKATLLNYIDKKSDRETVINQSIDLLNELDSNTIAVALSNAKTDLDKGFYEYSIVSRSASNDLKDKVLQDFSVKYPGHPINELIAKTNAEETATTTVVASGNDNNTDANAVAADVPAQALFTLHEGDKIAVLLPLTGRFAAVVGEPAKLGILTALKDRNSASKVVFYDTNKLNISDIVAKISNDGTKLIIGPVLKPEVKALNNANTKIPSIVFNDADNKSVNQWYFDLGPNYEGALAASKVYADGFKKPVVIAQSTDTSSQRSAINFKQNFDKVNKNTIICNYSDPNKIESQIANCPLAQADSAYISASVIDAVVIKQKIPANVAVYLTDKSYMGVNNTSQELALKGAKLGDMPWLLTDSALKDSFMKSLPKANSQVQRVFAASYDAINFAFSVNHLAQNRDDVLHGLTGDISLGQNGLIETSPMWVKLGKLR